MNDEERKYLIIRNDRHGANMSWIMGWDEAVTRYCEIGGEDDGSIILVEVVTYGEVPEGDSAAEDAVEPGSTTPFHSPYYDWPGHCGDWEDN
jgi:hypothetical protein